MLLVFGTSSFVLRTSPVSDPLKNLAEQFLAGRQSRSEFLSSLRAQLSVEFSDTTLDLDRVERCGFPEVIYGESKTVDQLARGIRGLIDAGHPVLVTRVSSDKASLLLDEFEDAQYNEVARTIRAGKKQCQSNRTVRQQVGVVSAGTSDLPIAEEAKETLEWMGVDVVTVNDVGVAGPHRLPMQLPRLDGASVIVVVAGMEGALPSVVGGYVSCPVIAVPTSVGYGANFGGLSALLGMLNSCAANVTVVNIDAGFKAGYVAGLIATGSDSSIKNGSEADR